MNLQLSETSSECFFPDIAKLEVFMKVLKVREGAGLNKAVTRQVKHKNDSEK